MSLRTSIGSSWGGGGPGWLRVVLGALTPLSWAYAAAVAARNGWYERYPPGPPPLPTIAVGNLTVGGTGKTPVLRALADWCESQGHAPCVVTRGYGADEVALYREWLGSERVFVAPRRLEGIRQAATVGLDVALVDDGFQHRAAPRSLDLLLVSADAPYPARLLPRGPYREPLNAARRADLILVTTRPGGAPADPWLGRLDESAPDVPALALPLGPTGWRSLQAHASGVGPGVGEETGPVPLDRTRGPSLEGAVLAVASIADPFGFERLLRATSPGLDVELAPYPDHYEYGTADVQELARRAGRRPIVTTEKDAVKLRAFEGLWARTWVLAFGVVGPLPDGLTRRLTALFEDGSA